jgi:hypothetical protein
MADVKMWEDFIDYVSLTKLSPPPPPPASEWWRFLQRGDEIEVFVTLCWWRMQVLDVDDTLSEIKVESGRYHVNTICTPGQIRPVPAGRFANVHDVRDVPRPARGRWNRVYRHALLVGGFATLLVRSFTRLLSTPPHGRAYLQAAKRFKGMQDFTEHPWQ